ncbi:hypothetical protein H0H93_008434 [Arthromyces matolae]|nr:hypothetical protein H0H93_008434 [Arthromyces matolae]
MEASRKRAHADTEDSIATKKRALTGPNGSPQVNGSAKEEFDEDNLELFRKEAIYRRMKHYSRECERCQTRIEDLEKRKQSCEMGLAAVMACWKQLVAMIRLLVKADEVPEVADNMFDFSVNIREGETPDFTKILEGNLQATTNLITQLIEASRGSQEPNIGSTKDYQKETYERISLQTQLELAHAKLEDAEELKDKYHRDLQRAESRCDRLKSKTVAALHSRQQEQQQLEDAEDVKEELQRKPPSPAGSKSPAPTNDGGDPHELDILRAQLAKREAKISELEQETSSATLNITMLEAEIKQLSYDKIVDNPHYKSLLNHAGFIQAALDSSRDLVTQLQEEINSLQVSRKEWEESAIVRLLSYSVFRDYIQYNHKSTANQANQELKVMLGKRDAENSRLREQREQQTAELMERKHQDIVKMTSLREMKALNDSRQACCSTLSERISALESQLARTKAWLAATAGDEDLMKFFLGGQTDEAGYFKALKQRADAAERRVLILEEKYQEIHPDVAQYIQAETDALQKLEEVQAELDRYKMVYGDASCLPPDTSVLADQLRHKEEEIQKLRLQETQHTQAETSLYTELDRLSNAWEALERQVKDKVFDLSNLENQLKKAVSEKAKSENKYYAAMRDKDAVSTETTKLQRNMEKQNKVVERLVDVEKNLTTQLNTLEKELATMRTICSTYKAKVDTLHINNLQLSERYEAEKQRVNEVQVTFREMEKANASKRAEIRKIEENLIRSKKELDMKMKQQESVVSRSDDDENRRLLSLLKCTTCHKEFRNTVITKCMHTYAKENFPV